MLFWLHICSLVFTCKSILYSWQEPQFPHWLSSLNMGYHIYFLLKTIEICFHSQLKSKCLSCTLEKMKQPVDCGLGGRLSRGQRAEGNVHLCNRDSGKAVSMSQHPLVSPSPRVSVGILQPQGLSQRHSYYLLKMFQWVKYPSRLLCPVAFMFPLSPTLTQSSSLPSRILLSFKCIRLHLAHEEAVLTELKKQNLPTSSMKFSP